MNREIYTRAILPHRKQYSKYNPFYKLCRVGQVFKLLASLGSKQQALALIEDILDVEGITQNESDTHEPEAEKAETTEEVSTRTPWI